MPGTALIRFVRPSASSQGITVPSSKVNDRLEFLSITANFSVSQIA